VKKIFLHIFLLLSSSATLYAQTPTIDSAKKIANSPSVKDTVVTPALFGGRGQYNTWSIGFNAGATSPSLITGGSYGYAAKKISLGYGISVRNQLGHSFALALDLRGGKVAANDGSAGPGAFSTQFWQAGISGVMNVASIDYLRRKNLVNFFVSAGGGLVWYNPTGTGSTGLPFDYKAESGHMVKELVLPIGAGVKFRVTDAVAVNLGYTQNFIDGTNFDGRKSNYPVKDSYSYGYAGLEFTLGKRTKPSLEWANSVTLMYDQLKDTLFMKKVDSLRVWIDALEKNTQDLKRDADGDGVGDQFDKCANTPAGTVVDGGGCGILFPAIVEGVLTGSETALPGTGSWEIYFKKGSDILGTSAYPVLDATAKSLRDVQYVTELQGYTSSDEGLQKAALILSKKRADAVQIYLTNSGVFGWQLYAKGYGKISPIADNSTEEGRIQNRRVQFKKRDIAYYDEIGFGANLSKSTKTNNLNTAVTYFKNNAAKRIYLIGHSSNNEQTNGKATDKQKLALALERAKSVAAYLKQKGISGNRIEIINQGSKYPIRGADNKPAEIISNQCVQIISW